MGGPSGRPPPGGTPSPPPGGHGRIRGQPATRRGRRACAVLVTATCFLHHPVTPDLPGLAMFRGTAFHSARWDQAAIEAAGAVAVIGTGSSGTQIVSALAGSVDR